MTKLMLCLSVLVSSLGPLAQYADDRATSDALVVRGLLSRTGNAGTLWRVKVDDSPTFRGETIRVATFTTRPGDEDSHTYAAYDGRYVEIVGEVRAVFDGIAILRIVRTIGILETAATQAPSVPELSALPPMRATSSPIQRRPYRHAYYLFLSGTGKGCEACYVPLLISQESLDVIAKNASPAHGVLIITYERDSIWEIKGTARVEPRSIDPDTRIVHMNGNSYRYQEAAAGEVIHLLENPAGTVPIARPFIMNKTVPGASVGELIEDFRHLRP